MDDFIRLIAIAVGTPLVLFAVVFGILWAMSIEHPSRSILASMFLFARAILWNWVAWVMGIIGVVLLVWQGFNPELRIAPWVWGYIILGGLLVSSFVGFHKLLAAKDEQTDKLGRLIARRHDMQQLIDRIAQDPGGVWIRAGKNLIASRPDGLCREAFFDPMWDCVELGVEQGLDVPFQNAISWLGQQEKPEKRIARDANDLKWGLDGIVKHFDRRIGELNRKVRH